MKEKIGELKDLAKTFPLEPGVYIMKNAKDKVIYVGKAKSLRARVKTYFGEGNDHSTKTRYLVAQIDRVEYILTKTEVEAFLLEASLIKKYRPRYNIRLKDDKAYPYIKVTISENFPRFYLARKVATDGSLFFGPYSSGLVVRETIRFMNKAFKIRDCTNSFFKSRTRPCISYQILQCTGPCVGLITQEAYKKDVMSSVSFLKGKKARILKVLKTQMKEASEDLRYETAAKIRDSINAIQAIWERQTVVSADREYDQDVVVFVGDKRGTLIETLHVRQGRVIGSRPHFLPKLDCTATHEEPKDWLTSFLNQYYSDNIIPDEILLPIDLGFDITKLLQAVFKERQGVVPRIGVATGSDGKKLLDMALANAESHYKDAVTKADQQLKGLEVIQEKFGLPELPRRIECFDISNFQGEENVASQVVFEDGVPKKEDYRKYKIKTVQGSNDFAAMKEVLSRRFGHTEYDDPQLVVVDGGKGQLSMAVEALKEIGRPEVPVVGLAKARTKGEFSDQEVASTQERFFLPGRQNFITFPSNTEAFQILVGIRDEAHRFAITFHRKRREARTMESALDGVIGLGEKRRIELLKAFGSVEMIRQASIEGLLQVKGMNRVLSERVLLHLKQLDEEE